MDGFTYIDGIVAAVVVVSGLLAYGRGILRETMAIAGWIAAAVAAFAFAPAVEPLMRQIPVVGDMLGESCELSIVAAFAVVFAAGLIVVSFFTPLLTGMVRDTAVGPIDQALGFVFGVARGILLVAVALVAYDRINFGEGLTAVDVSRTAVAFEDVQQRVEDALPDEAPGWIGEQYDGLVGACT